MMYKLIILIILIILSLFIYNKKVEQFDYTMGTFKTEDSQINKFEEVNKYLI